MSPHTSLQPLVRGGVALPHGLRPAIGVPAAPAGASTQTVDPLAVSLLLGVLALGILAWWWSRHSPVRRTRAAPDSSDAWDSLTLTAGQPDWYARLGRCVSVRYGQGLGDNRDVAAVLDVAVRRDATGAWAALQRRWEWAIYGGYPGGSDDHRTDLATAGKGWP